MNRLRNRRHTVEHDNVHRWLVSYADYMTLLFALFVVLYAMAMVNEKPFETITESVGRVFQADEVLAKHDENYMPPEVMDAMKKSGQTMPSMSQGI